MSKQYNTPIQYNPYNSNNNYNTRYNKDNRSRNNKFKDSRYSTPTTNNSKESYYY